MEKPENSRELKQLILSKEVEQKINRKMIKDQLDLTCNSLKPANLIESTLVKVHVPTDIKAELIKAFIGFTSAFIANKMLEKKERKSESALITSLVEISIADNTSNKTEEEKVLDHLMLKQVLYQYVISTQKNVSSN